MGRGVCGVDFHERKSSPTHCLSLLSSLCLCPLGGGFGAFSASRRRCRGESPSKKKEEKKRKKKRERIQVHTTACHVMPHQSTDAITFLSFFFFSFFLLRLCPPSDAPQLNATHAHTHRPMYVHICTYVQLDQIPDPEQGWKERKKKKKPKWPDWAMHPRMYDGNGLRANEQVQLK